MSQPIKGESRAWPPRSPHDALMSTPGGRDRARRLAERSSPSPLKRSATTPSIRSRARELLESDMGDAADDDDDEETLQLQLQEIQARLKLKKLQKNKGRAEPVDGGAQSWPATSSFPPPNPPRTDSVAETRSRSAAGVREDRIQRPKSQTEIHVPVSPVRKVQPVQEHRSPSRVLLGIDKGLKGSDVSLKSVPSPRKSHVSQASSFLQRATSQASMHSSQSFNRPSSTSDRPRAKTFSERMADIRNQENAKKEREQRIAQNRSKGFGIDEKEIQEFKNVAITIPEVPYQPPEFSRDQILNAYAPGLPRSSTAPDLRTQRPSTTITSSSSQSTAPSSQSFTKPPPKTRLTRKNAPPPAEVPEAEATQFEPYSKIHLSKRIIPHKVLTRTLTGKKTFMIPDMLKTVVAPNFLAPDVETDYVLLATVASKSEPRSHKAKATGEDRGKYMVMTLCDLKWELELFLFGSAFDKFRKITTGTVVALLNPGVMPPPPGRIDTNKFSLTLSNDFDTLLEIGMARDLGYCKSVKKDGKTCDSWIDKRHTEFCEFHVNESLSKTKSGRMEVNTMNFGAGKSRTFDFSWGPRKNNARDVTGLGDRPSLKKHGTIYDRESQSQIYIAGGSRGHTRDRDDMSTDPDAFLRGTTKEERIRRRHAEQEKERDIASKLGQIGGGAGAEYLRSKDTANTEMNDNNNNDRPAPPDAHALGLLAGKGAQVKLSPIKRKRPNTGSSTASPTPAMGWGSNMTKELGRMKNGENLQPVKKKTRFVTDRGIKIAGRDSLGGDAVKAQPSDDDDDLIIV